MPFCAKTSRILELYIKTGRSGLLQNIDYTTNKAMILTKSYINRIYDSIPQFQRNERMFAEDAFRTKVFLSHKHTDKKELLAVKRILEQCGASPYVDWMDSTMQQPTNAQTASNLKQKIINSNNLILVATDAAINSKWCNWELGIGDAYKHYHEKLALFPIKQDNYAWSGNEYMQLYPTIEWSNENDLSTLRRNGCGGGWREGYYVIYYESGHIVKAIPLNDWLANVV